MGYQLYNISMFWKWYLYFFFHDLLIQSTGWVGQIYKELYEIWTNYFNPEICFREGPALSKQSNIELYLVETLDQVEIGRYLPTYQDGIMITQKQYLAKVYGQILVLLSRANLKIIVVELSIPYESRMDQSPEYKTSKYKDL